ncbi:MAG: methyltransferase [Clostridia bacterium]|nr:methyltransferase [Clostridia bacterium]
METPIKQISGLRPETIRTFNDGVVRMMSVVLNLAADALDAQVVDEISRECGVSRAYAYAECLAALCGLDTSGRDRDLFRHYFLPMIHELDPAEFENDAYYQNIRITPGKSGKWEYRQMKLAPCEAFVCNDFLVTRDGRMIPQLGFFMREFAFPGVLENGREWMTLMPNETVTTRPALDAAHGRVLTFGLGLGYFAYMAARKSEVESVTVVDLSEDAIRLFEQNLLPQMECRDKIKVVHADAFAFAEQHYPKGE